MTVIRETYVVDPTDPTRKQHLDNLFTIPVAIDVAHHEVHEGDAYKIYVATADLGTADIGVRFTAPNNGLEKMHLLISAGSAEDAVLTFYEGGSPTGGGAFTPIQRRRDSSNTSNATGVFTGAVATGGSPTTLDVKRWGASGVGSVPGNAGGSRGQHEWILDVNTGYHIVMSGVGNSNAWLDLSWYEHTDV